MEKVKEVFALPVGEIIVPIDRIRKEFEMKKLRNLALSFQKGGQKQPGLCRREGDKIILVAGERRLRACEMLGIPYQFTLDEVGEDNTYEIKRIELEENICRENLTWLEEDNAVEELHQLEQSQHGVARVGIRGGHSIKDTAEIVQESVGSVSEAIKLSMFAKSSEEVRNAKTRTEAKKIVKRLEEKLDRYERLETAFKEETENTEEEVEITPESQMIFFSKKIHFARMEDKLKDYEDGYFDAVFFDPPWRVGLDSVRKKGGGTDDFEDDQLELGEFKSELERWLLLLYKKMALDSHLYLFFGIVNHFTVYEVIKEVGFVTNKIPLIWHKQGAHVTRNPDVWPGRSYEPIAFARKGSKNLVRKGASDIITTPCPTPSMKKNHPSAKHPMIYLELLQRSCLPGDKVLDPMCGSGMMAVAAEALEPSLKLKWEMIEKSSDFRRLAIVNVVDGFSNIAQRKEPEAPLETPSLDKLEDATKGGYKELEPGTTEWKFYWDNHPEEQDEILAWRKETGK
jgi:ParB family chromosome partitioning protein